MQRKLRKQLYYRGNGDVLRDHVDDRPLRLQRKAFQSPDIPKIYHRRGQQVPLLQLQHKQVGDRGIFQLQSHQLLWSRCLIHEHLREAVPLKQQCFVLRSFVRRITSVSSSVLALAHDPNHHDPNRHDPNHHDPNRFGHHGLGRRNPNGGCLQ